MRALKVLFEALFSGLMGWRDMVDNYCAMSSLVTQNSEFGIRNTDSGGKLQIRIDVSPALRTMTVKCSQIPL